MFLAGIPMPLINVPTTTLLQEMVEPDMQGRVFGVMQLIITTVLPVGMVVFGPVADLITIEFLFILTGGLLAAPGIWLFSNKVLRKTEPGAMPAD